MKNLGNYKTNKLDNYKFRKISGDNNKVHYDENFCLKTQFGIPIVYAQLIVVNCLLRLKTKKIIKNLNLIESLYCKFDKPVFLKEKIYFKYVLKKNLILINVSNQFELKSTIKLVLNKNKINNNTEDNYELGSLKAKLDKKELLKIKFMLLLSNKIGNYKRRNNVISNYEILFENNAKNYEKFYELKKINLVQLEKNYFGLFSKVYFFSYKPEFSKEKFSFRSNLLKNKKLNKKNFLVIGGSSGLGKIVTEFLSINKKKITFTYNTNHAEAKKIYNNLKHKNKELKYFKLNERMINKKEIKKKIYQHNYILFFATPKIFSGYREIFNFKKYEKFNKIYIGFLNKIVETLQTVSTKSVIFVPSTLLIEKKSFENPEYILSKIFLEKYITLINKKSKNVFIKTKRLGAYYSKQASHILGSSKNYNELVNKIFN